MPLRHVEMICPEDRGDEVGELIGDIETLDLWHDRLMDGKIMVRILVQAEQVEAVLDRLEGRYGGMDGFRVLVTSVEVALPHPDQAEADDAEAEAPEPSPGRISRHELYADISAAADTSRVFLIMVFLSSVVAAIGLARSNVAIIIGAMVIAPLLGPCMALALATTLADGDLGRRAVRTMAVGIVMVLTVSMVLGMAMSDTGGAAELLSRTDVRLGDVAVALASGAAGALAFTTGVHTPLVGVMVAVALLPPLVAVGLFMGAGSAAEAGRALLLFCTNLICANLAAVATFHYRGIRPRTWWEAGKAKRASRRALALWLLLLLALVIIILLWSR